MNNTIFSDSKSTIIRTQSQQESTNFETDANLGIVIQPVSCNLGCKKLWMRRAIHVNRTRVTVFDKTLATEAETKVESARRFKAFVFQQCDSNVHTYKLICKLSGINYSDENSVIKMQSVLKCKKIFNQIMEKELLHILN